MRGVTLSFFSSFSSCSAFLKLGLKFLRQAAEQLHHLPGAGMVEPQPHGVEALPLQARDRLFVPVNRVPQNGMADVGHMDANLVCPSSLQAALHIGEAGEPLQHGPVCDGGTAV